MRKSALAVIAGSLVLCAGAQEKGLVFAHRGGRAEFEENTLKAFKDSYAAGSRGFETDVRMTKDGALVILHNDTVDSMYAGKGSVEDMTAAEVRQLKSKRSGQPFLFLDDFLAFLADKPNMYVEFEMKTSNKKLYPDSRIPEYCEKVCKTVLAKRPADSIYVFTSFDARPLAYIGQHFPQAERLFISGSPVCEAVVKQAKGLGIKRIGCILDGTSRAAVRAAHKEGMIVSCWPGSNVKDYLLMYALDVDAMCSDVPVEVNAWKAAHLKGMK
jgi:glycerophosphoryl diester phosphodiesterase